MLGQTSRGGITTQPTQGLLYIEVANLFDKLKRLQEGELQTEGFRFHGVHVAVHIRTEMHSCEID